MKKIKRFVIPALAVAMVFTGCSKTASTQDNQTEAFEEAIQIVLSDGGITVNGKAAATDSGEAVYIGADIVYAYPDAKIGMMNAESAVKIIYADEIAASDNAGELIAEKAAAYDELQTSPLSAAGRGYIDDVIEPAATRKRVLAAFEMLCDKDMDRVAVKKHTTI